MTDAKEVILRIERSQERDWQAAYIRLLPPVPAPTPTPGCTCDWVEERVLCVAEPDYHHARYGEDCPDHEEPEPSPRCLTSLPPQSSTVSACMQINKGRP